MHGQKPELEVRVRFHQPVYRSQCTLLYLPINYTVLFSSSWFCCRSIVHLKCITFNINFPSNRACGVLSPIIIITLSHTYYYNHLFDDSRNGTKISEAILLNSSSLFLISGDFFFIFPCFLWNVRNEQLIKNCNCGDFHFRRHLVYPLPRSHSPHLHAADGIVWNS